MFGGLVLVGAAATIFKDDIRSGLDYFTTIVDDWGALGYAAYMLLYTLLEVLAVPAIPLTMTAGVLFGSLAGTAMVSVSATAAATIAFLISRYLARDKVPACPYHPPSPSLYPPFLNQHNIPPKPLIHAIRSKGDYAHILTHREEEM